MNKISLFNLSNLSSKENVATKAVADLDDNTAKALFGRGMLLPCPDTSEIRPTKDCVSCPYFGGVGYVEVSGDAPLENRFRTMCGCPRLRPLRDASMGKTQQYKDTLTRGAKSLSPEEKAVFIDANISVNCPLSRAKDGIWRVENPPCLACQYYGGLKSLSKPNENRVGLLCSHARGIRMTKPARGSMDILEEINNGSAK